MTAKKERQSLLDAAKKLGIPGITTRTPDDEIRAKIREILGEPDIGAESDQETQDRRTDSVASTLAAAGPDAVAKKTGAVVAHNANIPNLSPNGVWQGKRARIRRQKTGHNDMGGAIFNWNGWPTIIPIDTVVDVAWPIYEIIKNCVGITVEIIQEEDPRDKGRVRNIKKIDHFEKYPFSFMGITPGTEDLPESPWEYTLDMYAEGFPGYTVRMWRQLCIMWELSDAQCNVKPGISPKEEIEVRSNAIHYALNLPQETKKEIRYQVRNEKRIDIGMEPLTIKAA